MAKFDAVFVGLTILDIAGRPVSKIPDGGGVVFIEEIRLNPAGTAAGAVMNAAKLGSRTATVACRGADEKGDRSSTSIGGSGSIVRSFSAPARRRPRRPSSPSARTASAPRYTAAALRTISSSPRASSTPSATPASCTLAGRYLSRRWTDGQSAKLLRHAKAKGLTTTFDLIAPSDTTISLLTDLLPSVDYFMPSLEEAAFLSGRDDPAEAAAFFMDRGAGACIFKMGAKGSYTRTRDRAFRTPAFRVPVSDTTGCGDAYCGGFVVGLVEGLDLEAACRLGAAAAALVATGLGSDAGVIDRDAGRSLHGEGGEAALNIAPTLGTRGQGSHF